MVYNVFLKNLCIHTMKNIKKLTLSILVSTTSLSVLALVGTQQAQINNTKPFLIITLVTLILGAMASYQKHLQRL